MNNSCGKNKWLGWGIVIRFFPASTCQVKKEFSMLEITFIKFAGYLSNRLGMCA